MHNVNEAARDVISKINDAAVLYQKLVLLVGSRASGKTRTLQEVQNRTGAPRINLSLELSKRLLTLSEKERAQKVSQIFQDMLCEFHREDGTTFETVLLDDIEILFDPSLQLNPLQLMQLASRNRTLVVAWPGRVKDDVLVYAEPAHGEYLRVSTKGLILVTLD